MTLGDLFNAPTEFRLGDETFLVTKPNLLQEGEFQKWLQQLAFDDINSRTYQSEGEKLDSVRMHNQDCAAGVYEWGSKLSILRIQSQRGLAKLLAIICREQGLTDKKAAKLVEEQAAGLIQVLRDTVEKEQESADPKGLAETLSNLGSPSVFLLNVLLTHPLITPSTASASSPASS